ELLDVLAPSPSEGLAQVLTTEQFFQTDKQFVIRSYQVPGLTADYGFWLIVLSCDHRQSARSGFENNFRGSFPSGRKQENVGQLILFSQAVSSQQSGKH